MYKYTRNHSFSEFVIRDRNPDFGIIPSSLVRRFSHLLSDVVDCV